MAATITIDRSALAHNFQQVKSLLDSNSKIMTMVKSNGYGHGILPVCEVLGNSNNAADEIGVESFAYAQQLRKANITQDITVLAAQFSNEEFFLCPALNIRPVIYHESQLTLLNQLPRDLSLNIWVKVDTGMGRLGFLPEQLKDVLDTLEKNPAINQVSLMSHFANADNQTHALNAQQISAFNHLAASHSFTQVSLCNSAGIINFSESHHDLVRPGIMLYGISPVLGKTAKELNLKPVMTFSSQLISIKTLPKGHSVGYGSSYVCEQEQRIGIVQCGYGDGYPRHAPTGTPVLVNDEIAPLVGRVSMDMIAVDLSHCETARIGDKVTLWGNGLPIEVIAKKADTIAYELTCGITNRVKRELI